MTCSDPKIKNICKDKGQGCRNILVQSYPRKGKGLPNKPEEGKTTRWTRNPGTKNQKNFTLIALSDRSPKGKAPEGRQKTVYRTGSYCFKLNPQQKRFGRMSSAIVQNCLREHTPDFEKDSPFSKCVARGWGKRKR